MSMRLALTLLLVGGIVTFSRAEDRLRPPAIVTDSVPDVPPELAQRLRQ